MSKLTLDHTRRRRLDVLPTIFPYKGTEPVLLGRLLVPVGNPLFIHSSRAWLINYTELRPELKRNYHKIWKWRKESFMKENWLKKYFSIWQNREGRTEVKASEFSIRFHIPIQAMCLSTILNQSQRICICFLLYKGLNLSLGCLFIVLLFVVVLNKIL